MWHKLVKWPLSVQGRTFILERDEMDHLIEIAKTGPFSSKIFLGDGCVAVATATHAVMARVDQTQVSSIVQNELVPYDFSVVINSSAKLKIKDFCKGDKKNTKYFLFPIPSGELFVVRANCDVPEAEEFDNLDFNHAFILKGAPIENVTKAYAEADYRVGWVMPAIGVVPENQLWKMFALDQNQFSTPPARAVIRSSTLELMADTSKICSGLADISFSALDLGVLRAEFTTPSSKWIHIFTEIKANVVESMPPL